MRARFDLSDGTTLHDADHSFTTGPLPAAIWPTITVTQTPGFMNGGGVDLLNGIPTGGSSGGGANSPLVGALAFDTDGSVLWYYFDPKLNTGVNPLRQLDNGNFLFHASNTLREINLAGDVLRQITDQELSAALTAQGYTIDTPEVHHDVIELANGHWILLVREVLTYQDLPGYPGVTKVSGDVLVDLDPSNKPVWVWRAFDHLDINRHPIFFPDWTHGNAVVLTPDGNLLLSLRHQHWVLKIDYANGTGTGDVLWRLGPDGDFTLDAGDPAAWFYAQQRCGRVGAHRRRRLGLRHGLVPNVGRKRRHLAERRRGI